jgi:hypothetical protein
VKAWRRAWRKIVAVREFFTSGGRRRLLEIESNILIAV